MDHAEYTRMHEAEQRSWWFRGRRRVLDAVVGRLELRAGARIVDLGCGTGGNLGMLAQHGEVLGVEPSADAVAFAREGLDEPGSASATSVVHASAEATGLEGGAFDLITLLDVLEHLDDEGPALAEAARLLRPGAHLLVTVPAFMLLWSGHDEALHHRRRYRRPELVELLERAGFALCWASYYNASLFPPVAAVRVGRRLIGTGGERRADVGDGLPGPIAASLEALFAAERHLVGRARLPFGVSLIALVRWP